MRLRLPLTLGLLIVAAPAFAKPGARVFAIRELRVDGTVTEAERQRLKERAFVAAEMLIGQNSGTIVPSETVDRVLKERPTLRDCYDWRCNIEIADLLHANRVLIVRMERKGPPDRPGQWSVKALSFAADAIQLAGAPEEVSCDGCVAEDLVNRDLLTKTIDAVVRHDGTPALCRLRVDSAPSEAKISVDNTDLGATPFDRTISAGQHSITVEQSGYVASSAQIDCPRNGDRSLRLELATVHDGGNPPKGPAVGTTRPDRRGIYKALGFASLGLAVAGVAGLGAAVYYDGRPNCDLSNCPATYNTTSGIAVSAVGVAAFAVAAGVLLWLGYRTPHNVAIAPAGDARGASLQLRGSF